MMYSEYLSRAKYLLLVISKIVETFESQACDGFDIGCKFTKTIKASTLSEAFFANGHCICVNAFHGYSYQFLCQLDNHLSIIPSTGLEDFKIMEQVFSVSN